MIHDHRDFVEAYVAGFRAGFYEMEFRSVNGGFARVEVLRFSTTRGSVDPSRFAAFVMKVLRRNYYVVRSSARIAILEKFRIIETTGHCCSNSDGQNPPRGLHGREQVQWYDRLYLLLLCEWSASRSDLACSWRCTCMRHDRCCCRRDATPTCRSQTPPDVGWSAKFDHLQEESTRVSHERGDPARKSAGCAHALISKGARMRNLILEIQKDHN